MPLTAARQPVPVAPQSFVFVAAGRIFAELNGHGYLLDAEQTLQLSDESGELMLSAAGNMTGNTTGNVAGNAAAVIVISLPSATRTGAIWANVTCADERPGETTSIWPWRCTILPT